MQHNSTELTHVGGAHPGKPYAVALDYGGSAEQLAAVIEGSEHCEQEVAYHCRSARMHDKPGKPRPSAPLQGHAGWPQGTRWAHRRQCLLTRGCGHSCSPLYGGEKPGREGPTAVLALPPMSSCAPEGALGPLRVSPRHQKGKDGHTHPLAAVKVKLLGSNST